MESAVSASILVTGGAGYIGSHAVLAFREAGYAVAVLDDLSTGVRTAVPDDVPLIVGDVGDHSVVDGVIADYRIGGVIHFAGSIVVPESVADPLKYYRNNTSASRTLIEACVRSGVGKFIFSSTAAVYGTPEQVPVTEDTPTAPINPYGASKLVTEWVLRDVAAAHDFRYVALRYFNVAGADPAGRVGQSTPKATHLIKVACETAIGARDHIEVFGDDYDTPDGTCVRDYIHVTDLAEAHVMAFRHLEQGGDSRVLNCGYGHGFSVRQVLETVQQEANVRLDIRNAPRRTGDPPALVSDSSLLREAFGWTPRHDDLGAIVQTALAWEQKLGDLRPQIANVR